MVGIRSTIRIGLDSREFPVTGAEFMGLAIGAWALGYAASYTLTVFKKGAELIN